MSESASPPPIFGYQNSDPFSAAVTNSGKITKGGDEWDKEFEQTEDEALSEELLCNSQKVF